MGRRTVLLIGALVVAALGTALVYMYANRAEEAALAGQEPVQVLVATAGIQQGTTGSAVSESGSATLKALPAAAVPPGALSDLTPVADLVTISSVFEGQVLLQSMFGTQQQASGGLILPEGTMAVSVELEDPWRVAGFVQPGSEVAVFATVANVGEEEDPQTALLLGRVPVVAVGPTSVSASTTGAEDTTEEGDAQGDEEITSAILTLALNQQQAQKIIQSTLTGTLYLGLLDDQSAVDERAPSTTTNNVFD